MNQILPYANLNDYWKSRRQLNWCRVNSARNWSLNISLPIINVLLGSQHINVSEARCDGTELILGNCPFHIMPICSQVINQGIITDITDFSSLTMDDCVDQLNKLKIYLPFVKNNADQALAHKLFAQKVPAKSVNSEDIWRYADNIQIIAIYDDLLKPAKEFPLKNIDNLLKQLYSAIPKSDMTLWISDYTDYDLTNLYVVSDEVVGQDISQFVNLTNIQNFHNFIMDFTNLCQDHTISVDSSHQVIYQSIFDQSFIIFNGNVLGDLTEMIQSYVVPIWSRTILPDMIPTFFRTINDGQNEWITPSISIPYGYYARDLLRFYYEFSNDMILVFLKLILAWTLRNANDDLGVAAVNDLLGMLMGTDRATGQTSVIKQLEGELSMFLVDMTGIDKPVIYHTDHIDFTSDVTMTTTQTLDDMYTIMRQMNALRFLYIIDFGYGPNLSMSPSSVFLSMDNRFTDCGYLSMFLGSSTIEL